MKPDQRGQSITEYAFLIIVVAAAVVGISAYFQRSLNSSWRQAADGFGYGKQYDPPRTLRAPIVIGDDLFGWRFVCRGIRCWFEKTEGTIEEGGLGYLQYRVTRMGEPRVGRPRAPDLEDGLAALPGEDGAPPADDGLTGTRPPRDPGGDGGSACVGMDCLRQGLP